MKNNEMSNIHKLVKKNYLKYSFTSGVVLLLILVVYDIILSRNIESKLLFKLFSSFSTSFVFCGILTVPLKDAILKHHGFNSIIPALALLVIFVLMYISMFY